MQTFLPLPSFSASASVLDYRRLGKQRVECLQILNVLEGKSTGPGWSNHPCTNMWRGYAPALRLYQACIIQEWLDRGYSNSIPCEFDPCAKLPPWLGDETLHSSHRAALLYKEPEHYAKFGWAESPRLDYIWPNPLDIADPIGYNEGQ